MAGCGPSWRLVLLFSVIFLAIASAQLPTCEPFAGSPSYCSSIVTYPVYLPPGLTQEILAAALLKDLPEQAFGYIEPECRRYTILVRAIPTLHTRGNSPPTNRWHVDKPSALATALIPSCPHCRCVMILAPRSIRYVSVISGTALMAQLCADSLRAGGKNLTNCDNEKDLMNPTSNLFQDVSVRTLYQLFSY